MKLYFMKDKALAYFKGNLDFTSKYYLNKDISWMEEIYLNQSNVSNNIFAELKVDVPDFNLNMSAEKSDTTDFENMKIFYTALKNLSNSQATDERLWAGIAHANFWEYMQYRCKFNEADLTKNKIIGKFFFNHKHRSLILHPLAKLWWVGRLVYNEKKENPFEGLEYLKTDFGTKVLTLFSSNFTNNPKITRAILLAVSKLEKYGEKINRLKYFELIRYVNLLGGIVILDYLSEEELKEKIVEHYVEVNLKG